MSTNLQHLWVSVWGGTRVLGVSPKGSVRAERVCCSRQRGGGMRVLGVFENWAGRCVLDLNFGSLDYDGKTDRKTHTHRQTKWL